MNRKKINKTKIRILCLQSSQTEFEYLKKNLSDSGVIFQATDEESFAKNLRQQWFDIVLIDFYLPGLDAFKSLKISRELKPDVPVIFFSGQIEEETAFELIQKGAADYVQTDRIDRLPFTIKRLLAEKQLREQTEITLQQNYEKYRILYENASLSYQSLSKNGNLLDVNPTWLHMLGYDREQVIGKAFMDFLHPDWQVHFEKNFSTLKKLGSIKNLEFKIRHNYGHYVDISFNGCIEYEPNNSPLRIYCVFHDITERKQVQTALKQSEEKFKRLAEGAHDTIYRMSIPDGIYEYVSPAAEKLFGYSPQKFYENPVFIQKLIHPEWRNYFEEQWKNLTSGENLQDKYEYQIVHKSGETRWMNQRNVFIMGQDGKPIAIEGIVSDITELKKTDELQQENSNFLNSILQSIQDGMSVLDTDLTIRHVNNVIRTWYADRLPIEGQKCYKVYQHLDEPCNPCPILRCIQSGKTETDVVPGVPGSELEWIELFAYPIKDPASGKVTGVAEFVRNVSQRMRNMQDLQASEDSLRNMLDSMGDAVIAVDTNNHIIRMNPVAEKLTGWKLSRVKGKKLSQVFKVFNAKTRKPVVNLVDKVLKHGKLVGLANHTMLISRQGKEYQISDSAAPIRDAEGNITGVVMLFRDITQEYNMREQIAADEMKFHSLFEQAGDGLVIYDLDGNVKDANEQMCEMLQYDIKQMLKMHISAIHQKPDSEHSEPDYHIFLQKNVAEMETEIMTKSGDTKLVQVIAKKVEYNSDKFIYSMYRNITELKQAQNDLKRNKAFLQSFYDNTPIGIFVLDVADEKEYVFASVNKSFERIFNLENKTLLGKSPQKFFIEFSKKWVQSICNIFDDCIKKREQLVFEKEFFINSKEIILSIHISPLFDKNKKIYRLLGTILEVTEQRKAQKDLEKSEERFLEIAAQMPGSIYQFRADSDKNFSMTFLSRGAEQMFDGKLEELLDADNMFKDLHPDDRESFANSIHKSMQNLTEWDHEYRVVWPRDHTVHWIRGRSRPHQEVDGSIVWNGILLDITAQKTAEIEREKHRKDYENLFNAMLAGYALHEVILDDSGKPKDYRFLDINPAFERMTGLKRKDVFGKTVLQVIPKLDFMWIERYGHIALTGESIEFEQYTPELEKYYKVSAFSPEKHKFVTVFLDVTESRKIEAERQQKIKELIRTNRLMVGRENRMIEIKQEVNELCQALGKPKRYTTPDKIKE